MTHTDWDGQVVRIPVDVPGAGWPGDNPVSGR
jgi:hypothetical protein